MDDVEGTVPDGDDKEILEEAMVRFKHALDMDASNRTEALDDLKFVWNVDNYQWPQDAKDMREGRPMLTENRMPQFVRNVLSGIRKNRPAINLLPADEGADEVVADIMEGLIRHVEQRSRSDLATDNAAMYAVASSVGYFRITAEYSDDEGFDQEACIKPIDNPFTVYDDPDCQMPDKSDRKFCFVSEMVKRSEFKAEHGFEPADFASLAGLGDNAQHWASEDEVRIAEYWRIVKTKKKIYRFDGAEGPVTLKSDESGRYLDPASGQEVPEEVLKGMESRDIEVRVVEPYLLTADRVIKKSKWKGRLIPIVAVLGEEANIEGKKYRKSLIRDAKDSQRANNYYLSAEAEVISLQPKTPFIGEEGAFDVDTAKWQSANKKNHPYLEYKKGRPKPERNTPGQFPSGIREARMGAIEGMKATTGLFDASLGARSNETSGVALEERQQEGDKATFHFPDNLNRAIRYAGLVLVDLLPKIYDATRVVRILSPEGEAELKAINTVFIQPDGSLGKIDLAKGNYDVVVKAGPSAETQQQEERTHVVNLTKVMPQLTQVAPDLIMESMNFHNSHKYVERLKKTVPPQVLGEEEGGSPIPPEVQGAIQQAQQMGQQAQQMMAEAQAEAQQVEAAKKSLDADTKVFAAEQRAAKAEYAATCSGDKVAQMEARMPAEGEPVGAEEKLDVLIAMQQQLLEAILAPREKNAIVTENPDGSFSLHSMEQPSLPGPGSEVIQ